MNTTPRAEDYAVIVNADLSVLLINGALPHVPHDPPHFWQTCEPVNRAINQRYGLTVNTVRCLRVGFSGGIENSIYLMEYQAGGLPPGAEWVTPAKLPTLVGSVTTADVQGWLDWFSGDHPLRQKWYRPGYFEQIAASLPARLPGKTIIRVEHVRSWERSWVARIVTDSGDLYMKATPPMFAYEPELSAWLSAHYPDCFPSILSMHPGEDFIMGGYAGKSLMERPEIALWKQALARHAALQVDFIAHKKEFRVMGVPEWSLDWIAAHTNQLLNDETTLKSGNMPLTDEQIEQLRNIAPRLHHACEALTKYNIPLSLEHGDLWSGQIIAQPEGGFFYTDWSDCAITHPFFSLPFFIAEVHNELPGVSDARQQLTDAYLAEWNSFETPSRLREALTHVQLLSPWYTALRYYVDILPQMEIRWEMENMLTYNLRLLLRAI